MRVIVGSSDEGEIINKGREYERDSRHNGNQGYSSHMANYDQNKNINIDTGDNYRGYNQTTTEFSPRIPNKDRSKR